MKSIWFASSKLSYYKIIYIFVRLNGGGLLFGSQPNQQQKNAIRFYWNEAVALRIEAMQKWRST